MSLLRKYALPFFIFGITVMLPISAKSTDMDARALSIVKDFEQSVNNMVDGKASAIVVFSFFDKVTGTSNKLSKDAEEAIMKILLDKYLGKENVTIFNWKVADPLEIPTGLDTNGIRLGNNRLRNKVLKDVDIGLLITGYTHGNGRDIAISANLIDIASGRLVKASGNVPSSVAAKTLPMEKKVPTPRKEIDPPQKKDPPPELTTTVTKPTSREETAPTAGLYGALYVYTQPEDARIEFDDSDIAQFSQGIPLAAGQYGLRISADGYKEEVRRVSIDPGGTHNMSIRLSPIPEAQKGQFRVIKGKNYVYEGEVDGWKRHGQGTIRYENGDRYSGEWRNDLMHGQGDYHYANGDSYSGQWKDDAFHGRGTYIFKSGSRYVGGWRDDKKHGKATYYHKNGDTWEGYYINGKRHGKGIFTKANGESVEEYWENDKLLR